MVGKPGQSLMSDDVMLPVCDSVITYLNRESFCDDTQALGTQTTTTEYSGISFKIDQVQQLCSCCSRFGSVLDLKFKDVYKLLVTQVCEQSYSDDTQTLV